MATRKSTARLTSFERERFGRVLQTAKREGIWDTFVELHARATASTSPLEGSVINRAHFGPSFLPWHRAFLAMVEKKLEEISGDDKFFIPYWDWTLDPNGTSVFTPELVGGNGDSSDGWIVKDGLFRDWRIVKYDFTLKKMVVDVPLQRNFGSQGFIPDAYEISRVMFGANNYDNFPFNFFAKGSFRNDIEIKLHNPIHRWIGGPMTNPMLAPNDPVFFLHHANIDRLWAKWQHVHPQASYNVPSKLPSGLPMPDGQKPDDQLMGLSLTAQQAYDMKGDYDSADNLSLITGVSLTGFSNSQSKQGYRRIPIKNTMPIPDSSKYMVPGMTYNNCLFLKGEDHQLANYEIGILPITQESIPTEVVFPCNFNDKHQNKANSISASSTFIFVSNSF